MGAVEELAEEVTRWRARARPAWATLAGVRGHDHALRDASTAARVEELAQIEAFLSRAQRLPASYARDALMAFLETERADVVVVRGHERNPDIAVEYFDHLLALLLARHLSPQERLDALAGRLEGCRRFFEEGWDRYDPADVPPLWVEGAHETLKGADAFAAAIRAACAGGSAAAQRALTALADAEATLRQHGAWLAQLARDASGRIAVGDAALAELLRARRIDDTPDELESLGEALVARYRAELDEHARTVVAQSGQPPAPEVVAQAMSIVRADHPRTFADVLAFHEEAIRAAQAFVVARGLADVPDVPLDVVETPAFLRHLVPFAAYLPPARFASPVRGVYLVTPKVDLEAFARADVRNTVVHEAYPGHHLQLSWAAQRAPLAGYLGEAPDFAEGWALYCEWLMGHHGHASAPAERFVRAKDALWRALRIVLDVRLARGRVTPDAAAAVLVHEVAMDPDSARAEILRYTQTPGYNLSYMWGRVRIERLRERALAAGWSERAFHDAILAGGTAPVAVIEQALFGGR